MPFQTRSRFHQIVAVLMAVAGLGLASQVEVPLEPVPVTLQSLAVVFAGFFLGPLLASIATSIWLVCGACGLPLFAGGEGGIDHFTGPTAGYLLAFPFAAALAGYLARPKEPRLLRLFLAGLAAHALILAVGGLWLSAKIGVLIALEKGVLPFLPGAVLKSVAAAILLKLVRPSVTRTASAP